MNLKILIIGTCSQNGSELTHHLGVEYRNEKGIASDIRKLNNDVVDSGLFEVINVLNFNQIEHLVDIYQITDIY